MVRCIRHGKGDQVGMANVPVDVARLLEQYRAALGEETRPMFVVLRRGSHLRRDAQGQVIRLDGKGIERVTALLARQAQREAWLPIQRPKRPMSVSWPLRLATEAYHAKKC